MLLIADGLNLEGNKSSSRQKTAPDWFQGSLTCLGADGAHRDQI